MQQGRGPMGPGPGPGGPPMGGPHGGPPMDHRGGQIIISYVKTKKGRHQTVLRVYIHIGKLAGKI